MNVYFAPTFQHLIVQGTKFVWPPLSLKAQVVDGKIEIWLKEENRRIVGPVEFTEIQNQNGVPFPTLEAAKAYLDIEFAKGAEHHELSSQNW